MYSKENNSMFFNSVLIVLIVSISGIMLHELSHYLMSQLLGLNSVYHSSSVSLQPNQEIGKTIIVAGIGPIFSLVIGGISLISYFQIKNKSIFSYFLLWFSLYNIAIFFGYIMIAPFVKTGDTGIIMEYLKIPVYIRFLLAFLSYLFLRVVFPKFAYEFIKYSDSSILKQNSPKEIFIYPLLISTIIILILHYPFTIWVSILPILFIPLSFLGIIKSFRKIYQLPELKSKIVIKKNYLLLIICIISIILFLIFK